jgi:type I restriction enzyme R subunit/putative DNA methylase
MPTEPPIGWYSRGYQPHLNVPGLLQFVTFHLADSMPRATLRQLMADTRDNDIERRRRFERPWWSPSSTRWCCS